jgi:lipoate-protein ligase B
LQKQVLDKIRYRDEPHALILCEHPHTITQGRMTKESDLLVSPLKLKQLGVSNYAVERGGRITYHGPGQLVAYPVFDLNKFKKDLKFFLWSLEEVIINFLNNFNLEGERKPGYTGVWIKGRKIASIGIAVKRWITFHGLAINLNTDLEYFSFVRPCGLDIQMTSLSRFLCREIVIDNQLKGKLIDEFKKVFALETIKGGL